MEKYYKVFVLLGVIYYRIDQLCCENSTTGVITEAAVIMTPPTNQTKLEGEKLEFSCGVKTLPGNVTIQWWKDGQPIREVSSLETRLNIKEDGTLVVNPISSDDSGWYKCEVSNGIGDPQVASAYLNVEYPAKVTFTPTVQYLTFGRSVVVQCYIKANPPLQYIIWTKGKRLLEPYQTKDIIVMNNGSLLFTRVNQNHQGSYTCTPYNARGTQGSSYRMEVLVRKPPTFTVEPERHYQRKVGESIDMYCDAEDAEVTQKPKIEWQRKDGQPLPKDRVRISGGNITIDSLKSIDFGTYQCTASNEVATIMVSTQLDEEVRQPHAPYNISANTTEFSATVYWLPGFSGGLDYTIWYREAGISDWSRIPVVPQGNTFTTINNLKPSTTYEFQVVGKNALGDAMLGRIITARTLDICGEHLYQCKNGVCINETLICNGRRDCQHGDDEENCIAGRTNSSIFCAKTNGHCTCVDDDFSNKTVELPFVLNYMDTPIFLHLNCTDAGLTSFPKLLNKNLTYEIFLKGNKIPKLNARLLKDLDTLKILTLQKNEINTIENDTFRGIPIHQELTCLDLSDNNLTKLTPGMFKNLPKSWKFSLARNQINIIEKNALSNISVLGELDLSGNKLEKLTPGIFNSIGELNTSDEGSVYSAENGEPRFNILKTEFLNLKDNEIKSIEPYTFSSILDLKHLNLAGNKITKLTSGMFKGHLRLSKLDLEENEIDSIENNTFVHFERLNFLYLNRNKLTKLKRGMFNSTNLFLHYLDLRENEIDTIESYTFISFPTMHVLDLSYNKLTKLENHTFEELVVLKDLLLAKNKISYIEMSTFHELYELELLDLSYNKLTKLEDGIFKNLTVLKNLSLAENQISHIELSTFHELYKLELLNLAGNPLHEVDSRLFLHTNFEMVVLVDDMNICCQTNKTTCYLLNSALHYCGNTEQSIQNAEKAKWYIGIGVLLVAVIIILVTILKFDICGIKKKFSSYPHTAPNDEAQL